MSGGKAETLLGLSDLEICLSHQATGTDYRDTSEKSTQAGKGAELGFTPRADGESPELRFPSQHKFLALLEFFGLSHLSEHPGVLKIWLGLPSQPSREHSRVQSLQGRWAVPSRPRLPTWAVVSPVWEQ